MTTEEIVRLDIGQLSPPEAETQIALLKSNSDFLRKFHGSEPGGDLARSTWTVLHQLAYPEPSSIK